METALINEGILIQEENFTTKDILNVGEEDRRFSSFELWKINNLPFYGKYHSKRIDLYNQCAASLNDKLDIISFFNTISTVNSICLSTLSPEQIKLLPYLSERCNKPHGEEF